MLLARGDRFVALRVSAAVPALMLGIFGIAQGAGTCLIATWIKFARPWVLVADHVLGPRSCHEGDYS